MAEWAGDVVRGVFHVREMGRRGREKLGERVPSHKRLGTDSSGSNSDLSDRIGQERSWAVGSGQQGQPCCDRSQQAPNGQRARCRILLRTESVSARIFKLQHSLFAVWFERKNSIFLYQQSAPGTLIIDARSTTPITASPIHLGSGSATKICSPGLGLGRETAGRLITWRPNRQCRGSARRRRRPSGIQTPRLTGLAPSPHHLPHHAPISEAYSSGIPPSNHGSVPLDTTHRPHLSRVSGTVWLAGRASPPSLLPVSAPEPGVSFIDDPNHRPSADAPALPRPWNPG